MEWKTSAGPVPYEEAIAFMETRVEAIRAGTAKECIWFLEHPPLFTAGSSAVATDLIDNLGFPVYATGRGGQYTYHGPGQRVVYVMLDLKKREPDLKGFVAKLERWVITTLAKFDVKGEVRQGRVGVWVSSPHPTPLPPAGEGNEKPSPAGGRGLGEGSGEAKIAAIGIRVRKWVSYHGISINVSPNLSHYRGIVPCGIRDYGVTSLAALGVGVGMAEVDRELMKAFREVL